MTALKCKHPKWIFMETKTKNNSDFNFIKIRRAKMPPKMIIIILKEQTATNYEFSIFLLKSDS